MAEVVDAELQLEALPGAALRRDHDSRVVDQQVEAIDAGAEALGEGAHVIEVGEVERAELDLRVR